MKTSIKKIRSIVREMLEKVNAPINVDDIAKKIYDERDNISVDDVITVMSKSDFEWNDVEKEARDHYVFDFSFPKGPGGDYSFGIVVDVIVDEDQLGYEESDPDVGYHGGAYWDMDPFECKVKKFYVYDGMDDPIYVENNQLADAMTKWINKNGTFDKFLMDYIDPDKYREDMKDDYMPDEDDHPYYKNRYRY